MNRLENADTALRLIITEIKQALLIPDPVEQRREQVRIAKKVRHIANYMDDEGRLTE